MMYMEHVNATVHKIDNSLHLLKRAFPDLGIRGQGETSLKKWVHFGNDTTYITLNQYTNPAPVLPLDYSSAGVNHVAFVVDRIDEIDQRLQQAGYTPNEEHAEKSQFRIRQYYLDKNGMEWEFIQYLSDKPEERNYYA